MLGRLVWFRGPFWGQEADLTICKERFDKRLDKLGRFAIGDTVYRGLERVIQAPKTFGRNVSDDPAVVGVGRILHTPRALIESLNHRIRCWRIMDAWPFRENFMDHFEIAHVCARLTALSVSLAPLKVEPGFVSHHVR